jgi:hypothetical protein
MFRKIFGKKEQRKEKKFDASIPRRSYWSDDIGFPDKCPKCNTSLETEYHTYLFLTQERGEMVPFITGNHGGNFCSRCPVVVLNTDAFAKTALAGGSSKIAFTVAGIVDLDAIPEEKQHIPLGEDDNPIPLVEFLNNKDGSKKRRSINRKKRQRSKPRKKNKKR